MNQKQINQTLYKIQYHCEYLSLIFHRKKIIPPVNTVIPPAKQLCSSSVAKIIVQMAYLLYTCSFLKVDILLSANPIYYKKSKYSNYECKLIFYLVGEHFQKNKDNKQLEKRCEFFLCKALYFNQNVLTTIKNFFNKVSTFLSKKSQNQIITGLILNLIQYINKTISPQLLNEPTFSVIKCLENTELFSKFSDLLIFFRNSIFYQIKKQEQAIIIIRNSKALFQNIVYQPIEPKNYPYIYRELDMFILKLVDKQFFSLEKSSTKAIEGLIVGELVKIAEKNKQYQNYQAKFFINEHKFEHSTVKKDSEQQQVEVHHKLMPRMGYERSTFLLQYSCENSLITLKNMTYIEATQEIFDLISAYYSNISFKDIHICLQNLDMVKTNSKNVITKKYVGFKTSIRFEPLQQPFTKILILIEYLTIGARIYLELLGKRPEKNQPIAPEQYHKKLDHYLKLFVDKATHFYKSL